MSGLPRYPGGSDPLPPNERSPGWLAFVVGGGAAAWVVVALPLGLFGMAAPLVLPFVGLMFAALVGIALYEQNRADRP